MSKEPKIQIKPNGPYIVSGGVPLSEDAVAPDDSGGLDYYHVRDYEVPETYALCRCGASKKKPFCDGAHVHAEFEGEETADRAPYAERIQKYEGEVLELDDDNRCAFMRLCHKKDGDCWDLTEDATGGRLEEEAVAASWRCPTGRLVHHNKETGKVYEQEFEPSIILLEDTEEGVSGPCFVRGGIPLVGTDGFEYERRNRYALCRCGESKNKPFCDAKHVDAKFSDESSALHGEYGERDRSFGTDPEL